MWMILISISQAIVTKKFVKGFSHNFRIKFSFIISVYGFDLFIRVCLKADIRSNLISGFFIVVFVFFKIALVVI